MKSLAVLLGLVALCAGRELPNEEVPQVPGDNSHYVEGKSRYIWIPDGDGVPQLVDLHEPVDTDYDFSRAGHNNRYWLFTRENRDRAHIITHGNAGTLGTYRGARPLKVIVHGWRNDGNSGVNTMIRTAYLDVMDANVIVVDWRGLAGGTYLNAVRGVPSVGQYLGNFITWLITTAGGNWNQVHFIGFSLGAHVVGIAGRTTRTRPRRVTGLDPAGPEWGNNPNALNRNSGTYVECIHTDGRATGIMDPLGHADFYPNGGRHPQPGCALNPCSHGRSYQFFASSVRTNHFIGRRCNNLNEAQLSSCNGVQLRMGNRDMGKTGTGLFGLRTGRDWPF